MFGALSDCVPALKCCRHQEAPGVLLELLEREVDRYMKERILDPLCRDVEEDLRLGSHLHLQLDDRNPFRVCVCVLCVRVRVFHVWDSPLTGWTA